MKKIAIGILALAASSLSAQTEAAPAAAPESALSATLSVGYEMDYIFRGVKLAEDIQTASIDFSYQGAYAGMWSASAVGGDEENEIDYYLGYNIDASELVTVDLGLTYYTYPERTTLFDSGAEDNTAELYAGASFDLMLSPSVYAYYDVNLQNFTFETSVSHSIDLAQDMALDFGAFLGYVSLKDSKTVLGENDTFDDYYYYGASADVSYALADNASVSFGVRLQGSTEDQTWRNVAQDTVAGTAAEDIDSWEAYIGGSISIGF